MMMLNGWLLVRLHRRPNKDGLIELAKESTQQPLPEGTIVAIGFQEPQYDLKIGDVIYCPEHTRFPIPDEFLKKYMPNHEPDPGFYCLVRPNVISILIPSEDLKTLKLSKENA